MKNLPVPTARTSRLAALGLLAVALPAGCGHVTHTPLGAPATSAAATAPATPTGSPSTVDGVAPPPDRAPPPPTLPGLPALPPPSAATAAACPGRPEAAQITAALRKQPNLLPAGVTPTVATGPLCAGSWQYTVYAVPGFDRLQVVTKGSPTSLTVVTAGTDVCTPDVTDNAPAGIVAAAHCR